MTALVLGMARRSLIELRRYGFDAIFQVLGLTMVFLLLFWGAEGIGGDDVVNGDTLPSVVAGFVMFTVVLFTFFMIVQWVTNESMLGTLEQLALSPFGLYRVFLAEFAASLLYQMTLVCVLALTTMTLTGQWLHFDLITLIPLLAVALCGVLGLSFALAGAALVFKRVQSLMNLTQGLLLALIAVPLTQVPALRYAPIALPNSLIRESTVHGVRIFDMAPSDLLIAAVASAVYLALGSMIFMRMEARARERDLIGTY